MEHLVGLCPTSIVFNGSILSNDGGDAGTRVDSTHLVLCIRRHRDMFVGAAAHRELYGL